MMIFRSEYSIENLIYIWLCNFINNQIQMRGRGPAKVNKKKVERPGLTEDEI